MRSQEVQGDITTIPRPVRNLKPSPPLNPVFRLWFRGRTLPPLRITPSSDLHAAVFSLRWVGSLGLAAPRGQLAWG